MKRSSSFLKLEELTGNLIEASRVEEGFSADVNNSLGNLPNLPVSEEKDKEFHKELLQGGTSINPRDHFITVNNRFKRFKRFNSPEIEMTSNLSRTSSRLQTRGFSRLTPTVHTRHQPLRSFNVRRGGSDQDSAGPPSSSNLSSHELRSNRLRHQLSPSSMFSKWCSACLRILCLSSDCLTSFYSSSAQNLSEEQIITLVKNEFQRRNWSIDFKLVVQYNPEDNSLIFDGTALQ